MSNNPAAALRVAIVGAGISGLRCAQRLQETGITTTVFDKGRGVAGRMATRRMDDAWRFDHGAQYFTARGETFSREVRRWRGEGIVADYEGRAVSLEPGGRMAPDGGGPRYVGVPGMNALCKRLADGLDVQCGRTVQTIEHTDRQWRLVDAGGEALGRFDALVLAIPAPQVADLLPTDDPLRDAAESARMLPTLTMMVGFDKPLGLKFDLAFVEGGDLGLLTRQPSKPGRETGDGGEAWTVHAGHDWSRAHLESAPDDNIAPLLQAFAETVDRELPEPVVARVHRWRYAAVAQAVERPYLWDPARRLTACGDWCIGNRVECAFDSGDAAAEALIAGLTDG